MDNSKETKIWGGFRYFILFFLAFLPAAIFMFIKTGKESFDSSDPLFFKAVLVFFFIFLGISLFSDYRKSFLKCAICAQPGKDLLNSGSGPARHLCRNHLVEEFRKKFLATDYKMVVVYPGLEERTQSYYYSYCYYTAGDLKKYDFTDIALPLFQRGLKAISGKCLRCADTAAVAYFGKGSFTWENDYPLIDKITREPEVICKKCALDLIIPSLRGFKGDFVNPIEISPKGEGMLFTWTQ